MRYSLLPATVNDKDYLRSLHAQCYRSVVVAQFGAWDEKLQADFFEKKWDTTPFQLVLARNAVIGAIAFQRYSDHLFLEEVLIYPEYQNQGFGTEIVQQLLAEAAKDGLPVRLQVLRENGARSLYDRLGFVQIGKTDTHLLMEKTV